jgi:hypothetical protein
MKLSNFVFELYKKMRYFGTSLQIIIYVVLIFVVKPMRIFERLKYKIFYEKKKIKIL